MAATLTGLLILAVFFMGTPMMSRASLVGNVIIGSSTKEAIWVSGQRARTEIGIASTTGGSFCELTVDVDNSGATSIAGPSLMDVIVQFPSGNNQAQRLVHNPSGVPGVGEWAVTSISGNFEPGIFNPGEIMTIDAKLALVEAGDGTVTIGTEYGITDSAAFPTLSPCP